MINIANKANTHTTMETGTRGVAPSASHRAHPQNQAETGLVKVSSRQMFFLKHNMLITEERLILLWWKQRCQGK